MPSYDNDGHVYSGYKKATLKPKKPKKPGYDRRVAADARKSGSSYQQAAARRVDKPKYDRKAAAEARKKGTSYKSESASRSSAGESYAKSLEDRGNAYSKERSNRDVKMGEYRRGRVKMGLFKGKYYGPDAFKGDLSKVDAWRKAGGKKSDVKKFAKR